MGALISLVFNIDKPLSLLHGDAFLVNFILKHWMDVIYSGRWGSLATLPMFYGFTGSLFYTDHHLIQVLVALPFFIATKNIITTSNLVIVTTVVLSLVSMYLFTWYMTSNKIASVLASIVFVLNPFIMARFPDQLILFSLQWISLIFLFFERSLKKPTNANLFFFFFFLSIQLLSSLYYSVFLTAILPLYAGIRLVQEKPVFGKFLGIGAALGFTLFTVTSALSAWFYYGVFSKYPIGRTLEGTVVYSARVSDWFFTSEFNLLYGGLKEKFEQLFPNVVRRGIYSEQNLFWGVVPIVLFVISFRLLRKSLYKKLWAASLVVLVVSLLLSLGPEIILSDRLQFPGPYRLLYFINPLFHFLRTPARFGVFTFFFLSLIIGLTWTEVEKNLGTGRFFC